MRNSDYRKIEKMIEDNGLLDGQHGWEDLMDEIIRRNYDEKVAKKKARENG